MGLASVGKFLSAVGVRAMKKAAHDIAWRACKPFARDLRIKLINGNPWALRAPSYGDTFYREVLVAQNCQTVGAAIAAAAQSLGWSEARVQGHLRWIFTWRTPDGGRYIEIG